MAWLAVLRVTTPGNHGTLGGSGMLWVAALDLVWMRVLEELASDAEAFGLSVLVTSTTSTADSEAGSIALPMDLSILVAAFALWNFKDCNFALNDMISSLALVVLLLLLLSALLGLLFAPIGAAFLMTGPAIGLGRHRRACAATLI